MGPGITACADLWGRLRVRQWRCCQHPLQPPCASLRWATKGLLADLYDHLRTRRRRQRTRRHALTAPRSRTRHLVSGSAALVTTLPLPTCASDPLGQIDADATKPRCLGPAGATRRGSLYRDSRSGRCRSRSGPRQTSVEASCAPHRCVTQPGRVRVDVAAALAARPGLRRAVRVEDRPNPAPIASRRPTYPAAHIAVLAAGLTGAAPLGVAVRGPSHEPLRDRVAAASGLAV